MTSLNKNNSRPAQSIEPPKLKYKLKSKINKFKFKRNKFQFKRSTILAKDSQISATSDPKSEVESQNKTDDLNTTDKSSLLTMTQNLDSKNTNQFASILGALITSYVQQQGESLDEVNSDQVVNEKLCKKVSTNCELCSKKFTSRVLFKNHLLLRHRLTYSKYQAKLGRNKISSKLPIIISNRNETQSKLVNGNSQFSLSSQMGSKNSACSCSEISEALANVADLFSQGLQMLSSIKSAMSANSLSCTSKQSQGSSIIYTPAQKPISSTTFNHQNNLQADNLNVSALLKLAKSLSESDQKRVRN